MSLIIGLISGNELYFGADSRLTYCDGLIDTAFRKFWPRQTVDGQHYFLGSTGVARVSQACMAELKLDGLLTGLQEDYFRIGLRVRELMKEHDLLEKADSGRMYLAGGGRMLFGFRTPEGKLTLATLTGS